MSRPPARRQAPPSTPPPDPDLPAASARFPPLPRVQAPAPAPAPQAADPALERRTLQVIQAGLRAYDAIPPSSHWPDTVYRSCILPPVQFAVRRVRDLVYSPRTHRFVLRLSVVTIVYYLALFLALLAYIGFVNIWAPHAGFSKAVWLQYGEPGAPYAHLHFTPTAAGRQAYLFDSDELPSEFDTSFINDQAYDVTLELLLPVTSANVDLGNFMTTLELYNANGSIVWRASRPSILLTEPSPLRLLSSLSRVMQEPSISGLFDWVSGSGPGGVNLALAPLTWSVPTQVMSIPLLRRRVMQPSHAALSFLDPATATGRDTDRDRFEWTSPESLRVTSGLVTVGRSDSDRYWPSREGVQVQVQSYPLGSDVARSRGELQILMAQLRFNAHLTGLRYMLYYHPIFCFLAFSALFMAFEVFVGVGILALVALYTSTTVQQLLGMDQLRPEVPLVGTASPLSLHRPQRQEPQDDDAQPLLDRRTGSPDLPGGTEETESDTGTVTELGWGITETSEGQTTSNLGSEDTTSSLEADVGPTASGSAPQDWGLDAGLDFSGHARGESLGRLSELTEESTLSSSGVSEGVTF